MAEDRLFQMHVKRMLTNGRLSEMFGEKSLGVDRMFKTVNMGGLAREAGRKVDMDVICSGRKRIQKLIRSIRIMPMASMIV